MPHVTFVGRNVAVLCPFNSVGRDSTKSVYSTISDVRQITVVLDPTLGVNRFNESIPFAPEVCGSRVVNHVE